MVQCLVNRNLPDGEISHFPEQAFDSRSVDPLVTKGVFRERGLSLEEDDSFCRGQDRAA